MGGGGGLKMIQETGGGGSAAGRASGGEASAPQAEKIPGRWWAVGQRARRRKFCDSL
jgi:hypothetical protein